MFGGFDFVDFEFVLFDDYVKVFFLLLGVECFVLLMFGVNGFEFLVGELKLVVCDFMLCCFDCVVCEFDLEFVLNYLGLVLQWVVQVCVG